MSAEGITATDANTALGTIFTGTQYVQLHTGHPGSAGTSNVATNNTRQSITWSSASAGSIASATGQTWTSVSTTEVYAYFSIWSASTSGTFHGSGAVTSGSVTAGQDFSIAIAALTMSISVAA